MTTLAGVRHAMVCAALAAAVGAGACSRDSEQAAVAERQSASPVQQTAAPLTTTGCLRAGDAEGTFVLTAARAETGDQTATYHLVGDPTVKLADHIGQQVEVSGVLSAQQAIATRTTQDPAPNTTGTSGSPQVSSSTRLDIKRLEVQSVKPLGSACGG